MTDLYNKILAEALKLSPVERAYLVDKIISSFDFPACTETDQLSPKKAEERIDAYERGELPASPDKDVLKRLDRSQDR